VVLFVIIFLSNTYETNPTAISHHAGLKDSNNTQRCTHQFKGPSGFQIHSLQSILLDLSKWSLHLSLKVEKAENWIELNLTASRRNLNELEWQFLFEWTPLATYSAACVCWILRATIESVYYLNITNMEAFHIELLTRWRVSFVSCVCDQIMITILHVSQVILHLPG